MSGTRAGRRQGARRQRAPPPRQRARRQRDLAPRAPAPGPPAPRAPAPPGPVWRQDRSNRPETARLDRARVSDGDIQRSDCRENVVPPLVGTLVAPAPVEAVAPGEPRRLPGPLGARTVPTDRGTPVWAVFGGRMGTSSVQSAAEPSIRRWLERWWRQQRTVTQVAPAGRLAPQDVWRQDRSNRPGTARSGRARVSDGDTERSKGRGNVVPPLVGTLVAPAADSGRTRAVATRAGTAPAADPDPNRGAASGPVAPPGSRGIRHERVRSGSGLGRWRAARESIAQTEFGRDVRLARCRRLEFEAQVADRHP